MMKQDKRILIVDDDEDVLLAASMLLRRHYLHVNTARDPEKLVPLLRKERYDLILLDMNFTEDITSGREGFFWLRNIKTLAPETIVVMFTAFGGVEMAVKSIKEGAFDFVLKPWQNEKLLSTIQAGLQLGESKAEVNQLREREKGIAGLVNASPVEFIGTSRAMQEVLQTIRKVAPTDANVLITGENGTGKELVARELHRLSQRTSRVFISVDLGSLSGSLFESELFGHVKGAFTDARDDRQGRFELASGGTLFLDEIGNINPVQQSKLLTVIQSRQVTRIGSSKAVPVDLRLISATNVNIHEMVARQDFRQDLLYRINTVEIQLPPLRERKEDIALIAKYYLDFYSRKYQKKMAALPPETLKTLESHPWPGNVRELQHAIERAIILSDSGKLLPEDFNHGLSNPVQINQPTLNLDEIEKSAISNALKQSNGNVSVAARELGLSRAALYRRMERYGF